MKFKEEYCAEKDKAKPENKEKAVMSNEAYVLCDLLDQIKAHLFRSGRHG